jgi:hypothetical protein
LDVFTIWLDIRTECRFVIAWRPRRESQKSSLESQDRPGRPPCLAQPSGDPACAHPMHGTASAPHAHWITVKHHHRLAATIHRHNWISHNRLQFSIFRNRRSNLRIVRGVHRVSHSRPVTLRVRNRCMVLQAAGMLFVSPRSTTTDSRQRSTVAIGLSAAIFNFRKSPLKSQDRPGRPPCLTQPSGDPTCGQRMHGTAGGRHAHWITVKHHHRLATAIHRRNWIIGCNFQFSEIAARIAGSSGPSTAPHTAIW